MKLTVDQLHIALDRTAILRDVSLEARKGDIVGLVGPNGSGKSTLLRTVYRSLRPADGVVRVGEDDVWALSPRAAARRTAAVLQDAGGNTTGLTVTEIVALGRAPHHGLLGRDGAERSFVRAASRLYMTQPALSRQIRALEEDLGVVLFLRDRQGTVLTRAGHQLLEDAQPMLAMSQAVQQRARTASREVNQFTIGFMPAVVVTPIVREFARMAPELDIEVVHTSISDQVEFLLDGRVDVCYVRLPLPEGMFEVVPLFPEPRVVALSSEHPFAELKAVHVEDLRDMALLQDPQDVPEWRGRIPRDPVALPGDTGRFPATIEECLESVAFGSGCYVMPAGMAGFYRRDDVVYLTLEGVAPRMVALAYSKHRTMPELLQFAELSRRMLGPGPD